MVVHTVNISRSITTRILFNGIQERIEEESLRAGIINIFPTTGGGVSAYCIQQFDVFLLSNLTIICHRKLTESSRRFIFIHCNSFLWHLKKWHYCFFWLFNYKMSLRIRRVVILSLLIYAILIENGFQISASNDQRYVVLLIARLERTLMHEFLNSLKLTVLQQK